MEEIKSCKKNFLGFLSKFKRYIVFCHHNADPDAIGAAWVIYDYLKKNNKEVKIFAESYNSVSLKIIKELNNEAIFETASEVIIPIDTGIIIVDTADISQLGNLEKAVSEKMKEKNKVFLIDHHFSFNIASDNDSNNCVLKSVSSTCEIIGHIFKEIIFEGKISIVALTALLAGILYDTQRFYRSSFYTFDLVSIILKQGVDYDQVIELLSIYPDYSERMAKLKALQRMIIKTYNGIIIVMSHVSSYESSAARTMINNGADIAFVVSIKNDEIRASIRAQKTVAKIIDFQKVLQKITSKYGGSSGGHVSALGVNIPYKKPKKTIINKIQNDFFKFLVEELEKTSSSTPQTIWDEEK